MLIVAACGSGAASVYTPGEGGTLDGSFSDGHHILFEGGGNNDSSHGGICNPLTCAKLGYDCGPAGDGCGGALSCGTCTGKETCGGGGKFSQCGGDGSSTCVPKTC